MFPMKLSSTMNTDPRHPPALKQIVAVFGRLKPMAPQLRRAPLARPAAAPP
jgi:hypothetical protein